jgi:hypothetical protein
LELEPAMVRKLNWTPPANKARIELQSSPGSSAHPSSSSPSNLQKNTIFQTLSDTYGCKEKTQEPSIDLAKMNFKVVKKRKLIELVPIRPGEKSEPAELPEKPAAKAKDKAKAPKKRKQPQTITALATAAYRVPEQPETPASLALLPNYFPTEGKEGTPKETETAGKAKKLRKKTAKVSKKKAPPPKPILLSPRAALKQVSAQDFVFGTSSQLAREQSPALLRELHAAMRASNYDLDHAEDFATPINSDAIEAPEQRSKLWDAGARDTEGDLVDLEVIDLAGNSPQLPPLVDYGDPFGYNKNEGEGDVGPTKANDCPAPINDDSFVDLSDILPPPKLGLGDSAKTHDTPPMLDEASDSNLELHESAMAPLTEMRDMSKIEEPSVAEIEDSNQPQRPKFELYTDMQLSREIRSYGFKPVKRRKAMIALLDQCWESKARLHQNTNQVRAQSTASAPSLSASSGLFSAKARATDSGLAVDEPRREVTGLSPAAEQEPPPSAQAPTSPKRPRGRPRKEPGTPTNTKTKRAKTTAKKPAAAKPSLPPAKAATAPPKKPTTPRRKQKIPSTVIEIPDSADEGASNLSVTPVSSPEPTFSSPVAVDFSVSMDDDTDPSLLVTAPSDDQEAIFSYVMKAVTSAPRTMDPSNPSWHEKMLMYDPIVLEDLASWLNSGQLTRVGFDGEISPGQVKQWCESKSICCLYKVSLRGRERKRL